MVINHSEAHSLMSVHPTEELHGGCQIPASCSVASALKHAVPQAGGASNKKVCTMKPHAFLFSGELFEDI